MGPNVVRGRHGDIGAGIEETSNVCREVRLAQNWLQGKTRSNRKKGEELHSSSQKDISDILS